MVERNYGVFNRKKVCSLSKYRLYLLDGGTCGSGTHRHYNNILYNRGNYTKN